MLECPAILARVNASQPASASRVSAVCLSVYGGNGLTGVSFFSFVASPLPSAGNVQPSSGLPEVLSLRWERIHLNARNGLAA